MSSSKPNKRIYDLKYKTIRPNCWYSALVSWLQYNDNLNVWNL